MSRISLHDKQYNPSLWIIWDYEGDGRSIRKETV